MNSVRTAIYVVTLTLCSVAPAGRTLRQGQVFLNQAAATTALDVSVRNFSPIDQNVCATGGTFDRVANPSTMIVNTTPACPMWVAQTSPDVSPSGYGSSPNPCVRMPPNSYVNFHIRQSVGAPGCPGLQHGYVEVVLTVAEDKGALGASMFITQSASGGETTQAFTPLNGGRPF